MIYEQQLWIMGGFKYLKQQMLESGCDHFRARKLTGRDNRKASSAYASDVIPERQRIQKNER